MAQIGLGIYILVRTCLACMASIDIDARKRAAHFTRTHGQRLTDCLYQNLINRAAAATRSLTVGASIYFRLQTMETNRDFHLQLQQAFTHSR